MIASMLEQMNMNDHSTEQPEPTVVPNFVLARTSEEQSCFRTMEPALKKLHVMIQPVQQTNALYISSVDYWKQQVNNYLIETNAFSLIGHLTSNTSNRHVHTALIQLNNRVATTFHTLFDHQAISAQQYEHRISLTQSNQCQINQLYFLPTLQQNDVNVQPMVTYDAEEPMRMVADVMHGLLHPLVARVIHAQQTFFTGMEVIDAFECYAKQGQLRSSTLFATVQLGDLYHTCPHSCLLESLEKFLHAHAKQGHLCGISIHSILQLVQFTLENQYYVYDHTLYRQTVGGAVRSPLMRALVDIHLFYRYQQLFSMLLNRNELFGRCHDQIFLTWNGTRDDLQVFMHSTTLTDADPSTLSIDDQIHCFDAEIGHHQGQLQTRVYHQDAIEPYALPYVVDACTTQSHLLILRAALLRAILYSSNAAEFENERLFIDLSFIINDISLAFIQKTTEQVLQEFKVPSTEDCFDDTRFWQLQQRVRRYHRQQTRKRLQQRQRRRKQRQHTRL